MKTALPAVSRAFRTGSGSGSGLVPAVDGVGQSLHARRRELRALEGRQVVQEARRRVDRDPGMVAQRAERLVLQRVDAAVELVAAARVRPSRRRGSDAIGAGDVDVEDRGNRAPDVGDGLAGRARRCRARDRRPAVEQLDVRRQRDRDANQAVLRQVGEVVRGRAVDAEVIGVDRAEQRIVDAGRRSSAQTLPARPPASAGSSRNPCGSRNTPGRCRPGPRGSGRGSSPCLDRRATGFDRTRCRSTCLVQSACRLRPVGRQSALLSSPPPQAPTTMPPNSTRRCSQHGSCGGFSLHVCSPRMVSRSHAASRR